MRFRIYSSTIFLIAAIFFLHFRSSAHGIVIAGEKEQTELFNSDPTIVKKFAETITSKYDKVILHLGRSYVFRVGNIYTTNTSQRNLKLFSDILQLNGVKLIIWFLDSFGKEEFEILHAEYKEICNENLHMLDSLKITYQGIAIDLEWINLENGSNNARFEESIRYLRDKIQKEQKLYFFASLHETDKENYRRGFNNTLLDGNIATPMAMLYPLSSGFYLDGKKISPYMDNFRISFLKSFYKKMNWEVTVALGDKWIYPTGPDSSKIDILNIRLDNYSKHLMSNFTTKQEFWTQKGYTIIKSFRVEREKGKKIKLHRGDKIYHLSLDPSLAEPGDYIWEYYDLQNSKHLDHINRK